MNNNPNKITRVLPVAMLLALVCGLATLHSSTPDEYADVHASQTASANSLAGVSAASADATRSRIAAVDPPHALPSIWNFDASRFGKSRTTAEDPTAPDSPARQPGPDVPGVHAAPAVPVVPAVPSKDNSPAPPKANAPAPASAGRVTPAAAPVPSIPNDCPKLLQLVEERMYDQDAMSKLVKLAANTSTCTAGATIESQVDYVNGLIRQVTSDPYTYALNPASAKNQDAGMNGTASLFNGGGVGIGFRYDKRQQVNGKDRFNGAIWRVYPNTPAASVGITDGDELIEVNHKNVIGSDADAVMNSIKGPVGTTVSVTVLRDSRPKSFTLTRQVVQTYNVWVKDIGDGFFSIIVEDFASRQTPDRIREAIASTIDRAQGYVIDIRDNPGGLVESGVWSTELFVRDGLIISDRERQYEAVPTADPTKVSYVRNSWNVNEKTLIRQTDDGGKEISVTERSRQPYSVMGKPVVVLINGNTASAAEIFSSAMKGNYRSGALSQGGTIVGDDSFGKGIGQANDYGPDGTKVRVTSLHYFTHDGEWLGDGHNDKHPLHPDIKVANAKDVMRYTAEDLQLQTAKAELKRQVAPLVKTSGN